MKWIRIGGQLLPCCGKPLNKHKQPYRHPHCLAIHLKIYLSWSAQNIYPVFIEMVLVILFINKFFGHTGITNLNYKDWEYLSHLNHFTSISYLIAFVVAFIYGGLSRHHQWNWSRLRYRHSRLDRPAQSSLRVSPSYFFIVRSRRPTVQRGTAGLPRVLWPTSSVGRGEAMWTKEGAWLAPSGRLPVWPN